MAHAGVATAVMTAICIAATKLVAAELAVA